METVLASARLLNNLVKGRAVCLIKPLLKKELFLGNTQMREFICLSNTQKIVLS